MATRTARAAVLALGLLAGVGVGGASAQSTDFRIVAYNIRHGAGMDGQVDLVRIAETLRALDADVITLQEVDNRTQRTGGVDQTAVIAELLGYTGSFGAHRPYQGGEYGNAVLTRLPVLAARTHPIPGASGSALAIHELRVSVEGVGPVSVVSVHLAGSVEERGAQADSVARYFADVPYPTVLAGDFNERPDGPVIARLERDWTIVRKQGDGFTFPADEPDREIDFVMLRPAGAWEVVEHRVAAEAVAADHRPILAVLRGRKQAFLGLGPSSLPGWSEVEHHPRIRRSWTRAGRGVSPRLRTPSGSTRGYAAPHLPSRGS